MKIAPPTPELPVPDVPGAQAYYRDQLGFTIAWYNESGDIGAVCHGDCAIFFRKTSGKLPGGVFWIYCEDVDETYGELRRRGAPITEPIRNTAWNMRQFTVADPYGNTFYFHHDL